ncbi:MAG TPA: hypothetical protein VGO32_01945 [Candidatus Limnocylindria bacterium]|jgi:hypothetical protein|nr:hypothetical protein [Candidatus Limnocylindria bacterium]
MDSYSVNEAAAVLGIPEGRVWELLARGVLAGSTEVGGDMRVVLRGATLPDAAKPAAPNAFRQDANGGNGENGGGHGELTPFRELLTEFRNLTERYGQALLALGESRGEVAALRGRVDLLEARIEHRLPWTEAPRAGWNAEALSEPESSDAEPADPIETEELSSVDALPPEEVVEAARDEPMAEDVVAEDPIAEEVVAEVVAEDATADEVVAEGVVDEDPIAEEVVAEEGAGMADAETEARAEQRETDEAASDEQHTEEVKPRVSARSRSREAVSGFAEALARAEDPTTAEVLDGEESLPGGEDIADAIAAYRDEVAADAAPVVRVGYSTATPEPDWIAEEDLLVIGAAGDRATDVLSPEAPEFQVVGAEDAPEEDALTGDVPAEETPPADVLAREVDTETAAATIDEDEPAAWGAAPDASLEAETPASQVVESDEDQPPATSDSDYAWLDDEPEAEPTPRIAALAIGEPDESSAVAQQVTPDQPQARTPIEIAAEPPASDDVALLVGPVAFSEPPQIPREPAFWEPGARARAPFAVPHMDAWQASASEAMRVATEPEASRPEASRPEAPWPEVEVGWGSTPAPTGASASEASPSETSPSASPAPVRPKPAVRRRRGPAARAIRRLRILLD